MPGCRPPLQGSQGRHPGTGCTPFTVKSKERLNTLSLAVYVRLAFFHSYSVPAQPMECSCPHSRSAFVPQLTSRQPLIDAPTGQACLDKLFIKIFPVILGCSKISLNLTSTPCFRATQMGEMALKCFTSSSRSNQIEKSVPSSPLPSTPLLPIPPFPGVRSRG